jgi:hypothetical protein
MPDHSQLRAFPLTLMRMDVTSCPFFRVSCHFLAGIARLAWGAGATGPICQARVLHAPGCGARRDRRAGFYPFCRLQTRIIVVDPGFMVDPGYSRPRIHRGAWIHHGNRRTPPPGVAAAGPVAAVTSRAGTGRSRAHRDLDGQRAGRPDRCTQLARTLRRACVRQGRVATPPGPCPQRGVTS